MIRIAISTDLAGFRANATLLASILRRTSSSVHVRCWCRGFASESFEVKNLKVEFIPAIGDVPGRFPGYVTPAVFDRLRVIRDSPDWDSCLIMDYDQVAFCDLEPLFELDLGNSLLAAKMQAPGIDLAYAMENWIRRPFPVGWEGTARNQYFSMGPLLNLKEMRKSGTWEKLMAAQEAFQADENLALVAATEGRTLDFGPKWNLFAPQDLEGTVVPEGVVHWLGWPKPWHEGTEVWRPELWESERCSWEHLRMGLWDKPVTVEVEPDDDHGVEELLKRGWRVKLFTGSGDLAAEELPSFRYPDLEVGALCGKQQVSMEPSLVGMTRPSLISAQLERVRFGPWVRAAEWLDACGSLPDYVVLRGPQPADEVAQVVALGYGRVCTLRHHQWAAGGPMPRALVFSQVREIRSLDATDEWYFNRGDVMEFSHITSEIGRTEGCGTYRLAMEPVSSVKVGVLVAAVGKDRRQLRFFLEGLKRHFLPEVKMSVFVFTEGEPVGDGVVTIPVVPVGPELADLERYSWLLGAEAEFADCDFLYLLKPQVRMVGEIRWEELGGEGLSACLHSAYEGELRAEIRFEENQASVAWVGPGEGMQYFCGSWQGGFRERFLEAVRTISEWIGQDRRAGAEPFWGSESYWNRYLIDVAPERVLGAEYAWRTGTKLPRNGQPKVMVLPAAEGKPRETKPVRRSPLKRMQ